MSNEEFDRIHPAIVDTARTLPPPQAAHGHRQLPVPALVIAFLVLLAGLVFFMLPDYVAQRNAVAPRPAGEPPASAPATAPSGQAAPPSVVSPYAAATAERQRAAAKEALDALLALQYELGEHHAERWAAAELAQAAELATAGDAAYRDGDHAGAQARYHEATALLQSVRDGMGARLEDRLARGADALAAGDSAAASALFNEALLIDPSNTTAQHGLQRAGTLDQVLDLLRRAGTADAAGDSALAERLYSDALALDGEHEAARTALTELRKRIAARRYTGHLSAGFAALAAGDNAAASREFRAAIALQGNSAEARDGLQQAEFQLTQTRITTLLANARRAAGAERWQDAKRDFDAALAIDATLGPALEGSREAAGRIKLDEALAELERNPDRLLDPGTRTRTAELLEHATAITDAGPRLQAQLATARRLLGAYSTPVALRLRSDGATEVSVLRVGSYGVLTERTLELLPGNYVATGRRGGYRDVRIEFRVRPGQPVPDVVVQCVEKV